MLESPMEYPGLVPRKEARLVFRLWRQPAFDPEASWSLIRQEGVHYVRRIVCAPMAATEDGKIYRTDYDTYGEETVLPHAEADELVSRLMHIYLPPFIPQGPSGLDGCRYGIHCSDFLQEAQLSWWLRAPREWAEVRNWYAHALTVFQAHLPECSVQIQGRHPWVE